MKLANFFKRQRNSKPARPAVIADPLAHFSPRELADLPTWHPAEPTPSR